MARREMTEGDLCSLIDLAESVGIEIWLDGGWAVDAWLGHQTRTHADVDIVVETRSLATLVTALRELGYRDIPRDDTRAWNFVMGDDLGHEVDFHVIDLAPDGTGIYGPPPPEFIFPADSLTAVTEVCGRAVRAIPPHRLVEFHTGYDPDDDDRADVHALCERFAIEVPPIYRRAIRPIDSRSKPIDSR